jgi:hypothetical protein
METINLAAAILTLADRIYDHVWLEAEGAPPEEMNTLDRFNHYKNQLMEEQEHGKNPNKDEGS